MTLAEKLSPQRVTGYSPTMYRIVGAVTGITINAIDARPYREFSITSDGFVIAQPGSRESGDFLGTYSDFERNIRRYVEDAELTLDEQEQFAKLLSARVMDWRTAMHLQPKSAR